MTSYSRVFFYSDVILCDESLDVSAVVFTPEANRCSTVRLGLLQCHNDKEKTDHCIEQMMISDHYRPQDCKL